MENQLAKLVKSAIKGRGPFKIAFFSFISFCILATSLTFFVFSATKPYMGVRLSLTDSKWSVSMVDSTGLAIKSGIQIGDIPIEIDNQPAADFLAKYTQDGTVYGTLINELAVVDASGHQKLANVNTAGQSPESISELIVFFVISLVFWIIGFYVLLKKPRNLAAIILLIGSLDIGLAFSANMADVRGLQIAQILEVTASLLGPWILLHFFHALPEERTRVRTDRKIYFIYLMPVVTLILFPIIGYSNGQPEPWFRSVRVLEYGIGFLAVAVIAFFNYFRARSFKTRQQMKIVFISCLVALVPFALLTAIPDALMKHAIIPSQFGLMLVIFIPVGMAYSIITQKLMDIDLVIRRGVVYSAITLVIGAILAVAIFIVFSIQESVGILEEIILSLTLAAIATALFGPIKRGVEGVVDRLLYKDRYDYRQTINNISNSLNSLVDSKDVARFIVGTTVNTLNLSGACLLIKTPNSGYEIGAVQGKLSDTCSQKGLLALMSKRNAITEFPNSAFDLDHEIALIIPLKAGEKEVGVLCLPSKLSRQNFSSDDMYFLQSMSSIAASALRSSKLVQDVNLRDTFVSTASHELRTPLTSVLGYADLLMRRDPPEATRKLWAKNIFDSSQKITAMLDDLLNVSRIQSGKVNMKLEEVNLAGILTDKLAIFKDSTDKHQFEVDISRDLPEAIVDRDKFGQVIGNLLNNAIKYSPGGGKITLSARNNSERHQIVVSISDYGIGIAQADRELLFTTFHRIKRPETVGIRGSGLGLFIVKEWTEAMGGQVWFESEINMGSTFYVAVPASLSKL